MNNKVTVYSAVLAVVFAAVGCLGDNIAALYTTCTGLCIASLLVFIACLLRQEFAPKESEDTRINAQEKENLKNVA